MKQSHVLLGSQAVVSLVLERELLNEPVSLVAEEVPNNAKKHCRFFLNGLRWILFMTSVSVIYV